MVKRRVKHLGPFSSAPGLGAIQGERRLSNMKKNASPSRGLSDLIAHEGTAIASAVAAKCSCNGENSSCFKCDGSGYYERKLAPGAQALKPTAQSPHTEVAFSNDPRGGAYAIRENGRFGSLPLADDYDT